MEFLIQDFLYIDVLPAGEGAHEGDGIFLVDNGARQRQTDAQDGPGVRPDDQVAHHVLDQVDRVPGGGLVGNRAFLLGVNLARDIEKPAVDVLARQADADAQIAVQLKGQANGPATLLAADQPDFLDHAGVDQLLRDHRNARLGQTALLGQFCPGAQLVFMDQPHDQRTV